MDRITFTLDECGRIVRICADQEVEVYIVCPDVPRDRVYRWSSTQVGPEHVEEEIGGWPIGNRELMPRCHQAPSGALRAVFVRDRQVLCRVSVVPRQTGDKAATRERLQRRLERVRCLLRVHFLT
jgi:hypothetical protein